MDPTLIGGRGGRKAHVYAPAPSAAPTALSWGNKVNGACPTSPAVVKGV